MYYYYYNSINLLYIYYFNIEIYNNNHHNNIYNQSRKENCKIILHNWLCKNHKISHD